MKNLIILLLYASLLFASPVKENNNLKSLLQSVKEFVIKNYTLKIPKYEFHIEPSYISTQGSFAVISAIPLYEDNSSISTEYFEDIVFTLCLQKENNKWKVVYDLSRNDVPSIKEMIYIRQSFPSHFPIKLLPKFWKEKFETKEIIIDEKDNIIFEKNGKVLLKNHPLKDGKYEIWYDDFIYLKFSIKNQKLDGPYKEYYDYYTLYSEGYYKEGKPEGKSINYYKNGKKWFVQEYKNGKLQNQTTYDKDGDIISSD